MPFLPFLLLATAAPETPPAPAPQADIVVTGRRLDETARDLAACLARKCPPMEDMAATIRHAENQFVAGEYAGARATLKASTGRNDRFAKQYPHEVASLYRATGRVDANMGEAADYQKSTFAVGRSLRAGLPATDPALLMADLEAAEMRVRLRQYDSAYANYREVAGKARRQGRDDIATYAELKSAMLTAALGPDTAARNQLQKIATLPGDANASFRLAAKLLLVRLDRKAGKTDGVDQLLGEMRSVPGKAPTLLYSPSILTNPADQARQDASGNVLNRLSTGSFEDKWIDVGFWVRADGHVDDVEVLRARGKQDWIKPVMASLAGRRYAPFPTGDTGQGAYRIERFTYTSDWTDERLGNAPTGTRIRQRTAPKIERVDLSPEPSDQPLGTAAPARPTN